MHSTGGVPSFILGVINGSALHGAGWHQPHGACLKGSGPHSAAMAKLAGYLTSAFPVWVAAGGGLALFEPGWFTWFAPRIVPGLAVIMLGMGVVLARRHFADPLTAVPSAISSVFHSVIGSFLAGYWRLRGQGK
jgi:predicted Na+-dependent transporter